MALTRTNEKVEDLVRGTGTHFQCAPALLGFAEALWEDPVVVQHAADLAGGIGRPATQCAAARRIIPWRRIEALAFAR